MPIFAEEELFLFREKVNMVVVSTNGVITMAGKLVMGRGCARQLKEMIPGIDAEIAEIIEEQRMSTTRCERDWNGKTMRATYHNYGFLVIRNPIKTGKVGIGIFQVKECWWEDAQPWLIQLSTKMLGFFANEHPGIKIRMPFPGIGNGRISKDVVRPIIESLPDNVTVCYRKEGK